MYQNIAESSEIGGNLRMGNEQDSEKGKEFKLERYKYILQELRSLNEHVYKYLTLFQSLATAIVVGGVGVFVSWQSLKISADVARIGIQGLLGLLIILALFVLISIIAGMFSWVDYRKEEVKLLDEVVTPGYRKAPKLRNFWRWSETYVLLFIIIITITIALFVENQVVPLIR